MQGSAGLQAAGADRQCAKDSEDVALAEVVGADASTFDLAMVYLKLSIQHASILVNCDLPT